MEAYFARLLNNIVPVDEKDRNAIARDFVEAAQGALGVPRVEGFNKKPFTEGTGFFDLAYHPENNKRSSASVAYLHPVIYERPNLTLLLETWAYLRQLEGTRATGVHVRRRTARRASYGPGAKVPGRARARSTRRDCCCTPGSARPRPGGARRTRRPRPARRRREPARPPRVGHRLETDGPIPEGSRRWIRDAGLFVRRDPEQAGPDLMFHFYQIPFTDNPERLGYERPAHGVSMTPNIPKPRSRGRLDPTSADPSVKPALDFRYFTDEDDYDGRTLVEGIRIARRIARTEPLAGWLKREVCPGPEVTDDEELSAYARQVAHTVYHPAGTCRMGATDDPLAVVDPELRVRGLDGLRIADASVFPTMPAVNPMIGVLMVGEKCAELIGGGA